jgi:hypothetical protein
MSYISRVERKRLRNAAKAVLKQGAGLAQFSLFEINPYALGELSPLQLGAVRRWTDAIWAGDRCRCLLCDDVEFTMGGKHAPHVMAVTHAAGVASGALAVIANAICAGCSARPDLMEAALAKLREVFPDSKVLDAASVHVAGGAA